MNTDAYVKKFENYTLCNIKESKFKTNSLVFSYKYKISKENFIYFYLLTAILFSKSKKYNTKRKFNNNIADLYRPKLFSSFSLSGKYIIFQAKLTFLKEKYTEEGMDRKNIKFFLDSLFNPYVVDDEFDNEGFNLEVRRIIDDIISIKDNPDSYAMERLRKEFNRNSSFCYSLMNTEDEFRRITSKDLYKFYLKIINSGNLIVSFLGDTIFDYTKLINRYLKDRKNDNFKDSHLENLTVNSGVNKVKEKLDTKQSRLKIMYVYDKLTDFENKYVLKIFDFILGGSADSKLFKEVREKNSLCYRIYSGSSMLNNTMIVNAGINACNYDKTVELIEEQIDSIKKGNLNDSDIENAKKSYKTACIESLDYPGSIIASYLGSLYGTSDLIDDKMKKIDEVTKKDIVNVANKLHLDTIYFLEGDE